VRACTSRRRPGVALAAALAAGGLVLGACTSEPASSASSADAGRASSAPAGSDEPGGDQAGERGREQGGESADQPGEVRQPADGGTAEPVIEVDGVEVRPAGDEHAIPVAVAWADTPQLVTAAADFTAYVRAQTAALVTSTGDLAAAVHAGDVDRARALYPEAHAPWERIEPLGETSTGLDVRIDGKREDLAPGERVTGFHAVEQALFGSPDPAAALAAAGPDADRLLADARELQAHVARVDLSPLVAAATAKALLDEATNAKVTCTEEPWSHTELWDLAANVDGARAAVDTLRPYLAGADPQLLAQVDRRVAVLLRRLDTHRVGTGWRLSTELSPAELKVLSDAVRSLTETVSLLEAAVVPR
jgi:iron uptake system EfeUOB component EfeO/EfeM